jgi:type IV pilus assembly protein PilM
MSILDKTPYSGLETTPGRKNVMQFLSRKTKTLLGVDISSSAVKLVEFSMKNGCFRLENYVIGELPSSAVMERTRIEIGTVGNAIRLAMSMLKPGTKEAAVAIPGSAVITKIIEMDMQMNDSDIESQITVDADKYFPRTLGDVAIDFERQAQVDPRSGVVNVLLTACRKEEVSARAAALQSGGLIARVVDTETCAMERAFQLLLAQLAGGRTHTVAVLDIGASITTMHVLLQGRTIYAREQFFGGRQLVDDVQRRFELSAMEAKTAIRLGTLSDEYKHKILLPFKGALVQHISRSLEFFYSSSQYIDIDQIVLAGGVAAIHGLAEIVHEKLDKPAIVANPFRDIAVGSKVNRSLLVNDGPALMTACGLAMRSRY